MDVYVLEERRFRHQGMYVRDETIPVPPFPGFAIDLRNIFAEGNKKNGCCSNSGGNLRGAGPLFAGGPLGEGKALPLVNRLGIETEKIGDTNDR